MPTILFCLDHASFTSKGVNNGELLQDSETNQIAWNNKITEWVY